MDRLVIVALSRARGALERTMPCVNALRYSLVERLRPAEPVTQALDF
jgi:hypothetical protein